MTIKNRVKKLEEYSEVDDSNFEFPDRDTCSKMSVEQLTQIYLRYMKAGCKTKPSKGCNVPSSPQMSPTETTRFYYEIFHPERLHELE